MASFANPPGDSDESKFHLMGLILPHPGRKHIAVIVAAIALVFGLIVISNLIHHAVTVRQTGQSEVAVAEASAASHRDGSRTRLTQQRKGRSPRSRIIGEDGSTLRLVPGGKFTAPGLRESEAGTSFRVAPLYMGETEVTNAQYVAFLNQVLEQIAVENGAVENEGTPWLVLGEVFRGYEPIVFQNGEFAVKDPQHSTYPVVQVTANGASAYARFYDARLPTEFEWYAAVAPEKDPAANDRNKAVTSGEELSSLEREMSGLVEAYGALDEYEVDSSSDSSRPSRVPYSVSKYPPNAYGIRGLRGNIAEWGLRSRTEGPHDEFAGAFVILGEIEGTWLLGTTLIRGPEQNAGVASASVGFRVAKDVAAGTGQQE